MKKTFNASYNYIRILIDLSDKTIKDMRSKIHLTQNYVLHYFYTILGHVHIFFNSCL